MNFMVMSMARTGGTYITNLLPSAYRQKNNDYSNFINVNELFARGSSPKTFRLKPNKKLERIPAEIPPPNFEDDYFIDKFDHYDKAFHLLENTITNVSVNIHSHLLMYMDRTRLDKLLTNKPYKKIFVYRSDIEDMMLSFMYTMMTGEYNIYSEEGKEYKVGDSYSFEKLQKTHHYKVEWMFNLINLHSYIYKQFDWDYVIKYEDFTGDQVLDAKKFVGCNDFKRGNLPVKLMSKQDKIDRLVDYPIFFELFEKHRKLHRLPSFVEL